MDISRRSFFGLTAGGIGLVGCGQGQVGSAAESPWMPSTSPAQFEHGVASGDATSERVILWTRVTPSDPEAASLSVRCVISTDRSIVENASEDVRTTGDGRVQVLVSTTNPGRDFTVKIDAGFGSDELKLAADSQYFYQFSVRTPDGIVYSPVGTTRTLPASGGDQLKVAVVSCSNYPFGYFNVYEAIAQRNDIDAVFHLGDYFYEYGIDGYGGETGEQLGRRHDPVTETVTLEDYRLRHAQYKSDTRLQAAHAVAPWYCTWDDHESTNNSYRNGAENHNPDQGEGDWTERKQTAVQAYLEWMPVRDPEVGRARESIYRSVDFGDLASLFMLESRLTGRSDEISWFTELGGLEPERVPLQSMITMGKVMDQNRTMLGQVQEDWLAEGLKASVEGGKTWQFLANQVVMANVKPPNLTQELSEEEVASITNGYARQLVPFSQLGLPWNLDAWDGFPAARERLYKSAKDAGARLITVTGDTHTAWANNLHSLSGELRGVEFGCTSVTSPGFGTYMPVERLGRLFAEANRDVAWYDPFGNGFTVVTLTPETARADYFKVSTVVEEAYETVQVTSFETAKTNEGMTPLREV